MVCATIGRIVLVILNIVFLILSLGLLAVGVLLKFFVGKIFSYLFDIVEKNIDNLPFKVPPDANPDFLPILDKVGLALIIFGSILLVLSILACCGACYTLRPFLIIFVIVLIIMIIILAVVGGLFLTKGSQLHSDIKSTLSDKLKSDYKGPLENDDMFTLIINMLTYAMECCGFAGPDDFDTKETGWKTYDDTARNPNAPVIKIEVTPGCCKHEYLDVGNLTCAQTTKDATRIHTQGCYDKLYDLLGDHKKWAIVVLVVILALQVTEVIFAIIIVKDAKSISPI